jgi:bacillithiol biosynthesis cysteine-adding enzyme BshC
LTIKDLDTATATVHNTVSPIKYSHLTGFSRSWQAVTSREAVAASLYLRPPMNVDACGQSARETLRQSRPWAKLAEIIRDSSRRFGVSAHTLDRLTLLAEGKAVMVVTGQQVGYLGGPLYTFLKAYHAIRLASELEERLGLPVLPLFWLEGRDHDLEEVRHADWVKNDGSLSTLRFTPEQEVSGFEVGFYQVRAAEHLQELTAGLEHPDESGLRVLQAAYDDATLTDGMGRLLAAVLGPRGLLVIEGMDARLKSLALPLWEQILSAGPRLTELLHARAGELTGAGWNAPMTPTPDSYLFYLSRDHRRAAVSYDGRVRHPDGRTEQMSVDQLRQLIRSDPDAMSPKAALRPVYQDFLLPTIAYVAGPGEMDYHAQLTPFYREFGVTPPSLFPRLSVTVTDSRAVRQMDKLSLTPHQVLATPSGELLKSILREADDGQTAALFERSRDDIQSVFDRVRTQLTDIDPTLAGLVQTSAGKALHPLEHLREKTEKALKQRHATTLSRLEKILNIMHPRDKLAERVLCTGYYLLRYGPERVLSALDQLPALPTEHFVISIDS